MKFNTSFICFVISLCISLASAQFYGFGSLQNQFGNGFGNPSAFAGPAVRDPRDNPGRSGPVVFPPSPPDAPEESSGVIIGGSGFGFVPPQQQSKI